MIDTMPQPGPVAQEATRLAAQAAGQARQTGRNADAASLNGFRLDQARSAGQANDQQLRELTEMVVSTTFIAPMFAQLRDDPLAANLMHGGRGESVFQQQLDQILSDRIAGASNFGLADALYKQFNKTAGNTLNTHG